MYLGEWLLVLLLAVALNNVRKQTVAQGPDVADVPEASGIAAPEITDFDASHFVRNVGYATQVGAFAE